MIIQYYKIVFLLQNEKTNDFLEERTRLHKKHRQTSF